MTIVAPDVFAAPNVFASPLVYPCSKFVVDPGFIFPVQPDPTPPLWSTAHAYIIGNYVYSPGFLLYICIVNHTSGDFATDLANGYWSAVQDVDLTTTTLEAGAQSFWLAGTNNYTNYLYEDDQGNIAVNAGATVDVRAITFSTPPLAAQVTGSILFTLDIYAKQMVAFPPLVTGNIGMFLGKWNANNTKGTVFNNFKLGAAVSSTSYQLFNITQLQIGGITLNEGDKIVAQLYWRIVNSSLSGYFGRWIAIGMGDATHQTAIRSTVPLQVRSTIPMEASGSGEWTQWHAIAP